MSKDFVKLDQGKLRHSLLPAKCMDGVLKVLEFGAQKYEVGGWKKCNEISRYYNALHRHLESFWSGEDIDPESGLHHLDHVMCNVVFLRWFMENKPEADDRGE